MTSSGGHLYWYDINYNYALSMLIERTPGLPSLLSNVRCTGNESNLLQCNHDRLPPIDCDDAVGILCQINIESV